MMPKQPKSAGGACRSLFTLRSGGGSSFFVGGPHMITFRFIAFLLLGISCHAAPSITNAPAGAYICDEGAALKIHLVIKQGGTYEASLEQPTGGAS